MANLITTHDPFHIHKTLGLLVLLNFAYRLCLYLWRGNAFCHVGNEACSEKEIYFDVACVIVHGCLSWSSLLMPLPKKRNFNSPMIWREFRWHSILFATRAVLATVVSILGLWPQHWALNYAAKVALVMGTCTAADVATQIHGCKTNRTTNAMAYPDYVTPALQQKIKLNYSMAQMAATLSCITGDPTLSFLSLYAIQGAAFLMTLRRKNIIGTRTVHYIYQLQLCAMYLPQIVELCHFTTSSPDHWVTIFQLGLLSWVAGYMRMDCRHSKWVVWGVCLALWQLFTYHQGSRDVLLWLHTHPVGIAYMIFSHVNENQRVLKHYLPIWLGQAPKEETPRKPHATQSLARDLLENDMLAYPDRRQRFLIVFTTMLGTHFRALEVAKEVAATVVAAF